MPGKRPVLVCVVFRVSVLSESLAQELYLDIGRDALVQDVVDGVQYGHVNVHVLVDVLHTLGAEIAFGKKGTNINLPIETVDPSVDTKHCIIRVQRNKRGELQYILWDAPSNTGTFYMNDILGDNEKVSLSDGDIITIGATTLILRTAKDGEAEE